MDGWFRFTPQPAHRNAATAQRGVSDGGGIDGPMQPSMVLQTIHAGQLLSDGRRLLA